MDGHDPTIVHTHWYPLVILLKYTTPFGPIAEAIYYHPDPIQREQCTQIAIFVVILYPLTFKLMVNYGAPYLVETVYPAVSDFINRALR